MVQIVARWLGHAGVLANAAGARDSTACPAEAGKRRAHNAAQPKAPRPSKALVVEARPPALGGHSLVACTSGWKCTVCRVMSAEWNRIAPRRCDGSVLAKWAVRDADDDSKGMHHHPSHSRWISGDLVFCSACGAHSEHAVKLLAGHCKGLKKGTTTVRNRLCLGKHPRTNELLQHPPVPEHAWQTMPIMPAAVKPDEPAHAVAVPRGSAAAAKRRHAVGVVGRDERPRRPPPVAAAPESSRDDYGIAAVHVVASTTVWENRGVEALFETQESDEEWWSRMDDDLEVEHPVMNDPGVESLFEGESSGPAEVDYELLSSCPAEVDAVVTRSQGSLTADLRKRSVGGAAALSPVTKAPSTKAEPSRNIPSTQQITATPPAAALPSDAASALARQKDKACALLSAATACSPPPVARSQRRLQLASDLQASQRACVRSLRCATPASRHSEASYSCG